MICAWMVTSSAVVGSSAISSCGSQTSAMAIMARWRMPPESWCGYSSTRRAGKGMPTWASASMARSRASFLPMPRWARSVSPICWPTVKTGSSALIGSWKIMLIWRPRTSRISRDGSCQRSRPSKAIWPATRLGARRQQAQDRQAGDGLAAARFAHDADALAGAHGEADVARGLHLAGLGAEMDPESAHIEKGGGFVDCRHCSKVDRMPHSDLARGLAQLAQLAQSFGGPRLDIPSLDVCRALW